MIYKCQVLLYLCRFICIFINILIDSNSIVGKIADLTGYNNITTCRVHTTTNKHHTKIKIEKWSRYWKKLFQSSCKVLQTHKTDLWKTKTNKQQNKKEPVCAVSEWVRIELTYLHVNWLMECVWMWIIRLMKVPGDSAALSQVCTPSSPSTQQIVSNSAIIYHERTRKRINQGKSDWLNLQRRRCWSVRGEGEEVVVASFYPGGGKKKKKRERALEEEIKQLPSF